jgi:hypothetical protein
MIVDLVPLGALVLGIGWVSWANRTRRGAGTRESVEAHQRLLHALEPQAGSQARREVEHSH